MIVRKVSSASAPGMFVLFGQVLASLVALRLTCNLLLFLYNHYLQRLVSLRSSIWRPRPDNWAIVTGGTDGIGLAYVRALASKGYPVLIISRNLDKLNKVKDDIEQDIAACPEIRVVAFDFSQNKLGHYDRVERAIDRLPCIDVIVNNVGISFNTAEYFSIIAKRDRHLLGSMVNVNIVSVVKMSAMVLDRMKSQRRGIVLNIASLSALSPVPLLALYSATKAFVDDFSACLADQLHHEGFANQIIVQSVLPGFVSTKMSHLRASWRVPTASAYVASALASVGRSTRTYGYWWHSLLGTAYSLCQALLGQRFYSKLAFTQLLKLRSRYYRLKNIPDPFNQDRAN